MDAGRVVFFVCAIVGLASILRSTSADLSNICEFERRFPGETDCCYTEEQRKLWHGSCASDDASAEPTDRTSDTEPTKTASTDPNDLASSSTEQGDSTGPTNVTADGGRTDTGSPPSASVLSTAATASGKRSPSSDGQTSPSAVDGATAHTDPTNTAVSSTGPGTTTATEEGITTGPITDTEVVGTTGTTTVTVDGGTTTVAEGPLSPSTAEAVTDDAMTPCPPNMVHGNCTCHGTCEDPNGSSGCLSHFCRPGTTVCYCPVGYLMNGDDCVPRSECPCFWSGVDIVIPNGQYRVDSDCTKMRSCTNDELTAEEDYQCSSDAQCDVRDGIRQCYCNDGFRGDGQNCDPLYADCNDAYEAGQTQDGVYLIKPTNWSGTVFNVSCLMSENGGGWTVFQRRKDGQTDFYRSWTSYREGFGSFAGDFWLGNEKIHHLTNQKRYKLRVDYWTSGGGALYAEYSRFSIGAEDDKYRLTATGASGHAGKSMFYNNGQAFSTYDRDNDGCGTQNFAEMSRGAWWYGDSSHCSWDSDKRHCQRFPFEDRQDIYGRVTYSNLNGDYDGGDGQNIFWSDSHHYCNLNFTEMKIRPAD